MNKNKIVIIGAGPVGLLLANLLGNKGIPTLVLEKSLLPGDSARAIGISIPSLEIFSKLHLDSKISTAGTKVRSVIIHGDQKVLGEIAFAGLETEFDYVLSIPQCKTERILEANLQNYPSVEVRRGFQVESIGSAPTDILIEGTRQNGVNFKVSGSYAVACDGGRSASRQSAGIAFKGGEYSDTFLMGDFEDHTSWGSAAHVFFTRKGSAESFPLPGGLRRYVLRTPELIQESSGGYLEVQVSDRTGVDLSGSRKAWESSFTVQRFIARKYFSGRLLLAGDAAHLMSPIVGQNMNTGIADGEFLANILPEALKNEDRASDLFELYHRIRSKAAEAASFRAWLMMRFGTSGGTVWSPVRNMIVAMLLRGPLKTLVPPFFSMMSIPYRNLDDPKIPLPASGGADART